MRQLSGPSPLSVLCPCAPPSHLAGVCATARKADVGGRLGVGVGGAGCSSFLMASNRRRYICIYISGGVILVACLGNTHRLLSRLAHLGAVAGADRAGEHDRAVRGVRDCENLPTVPRELADGTMCRCVGGDALLVKESKGELVGGAWASREGCRERQRHKRISD